jgi:D-xylose transport system substrate-binding protein
VPYVKLQAVAVDKTNMRDVIIREGFHRYEEVYRDQRKDL